MTGVYNSSMSLEIENIRDFEKKYGLVMALFIGPDSADEYRKRWEKYIALLSPEMGWVKRKSVNFMLSKMSELAGKGVLVKREFLEAVVGYPDKRVGLLLTGLFLLPDDLIMAVLVRPDFSEEDRKVAIGCQMNLGLPLEKLGPLIRESQTVNLIINTASIEKVMDFE